jgi:hypothetical protein
MSLESALERWRTKPVSRILSHGMCCHMAREWLVSMDKSMLRDNNPLSGPKWLREKYEWGPVSWPLYWCEAVRSDHLDCGALAAISRELFLARGIVCLPVQMIQRYPPHVVQHWVSMWSRAGMPATWVEGTLVYHEACAVVRQGNVVEVWDPVEACWLDPSTKGYGAIMALKVSFSELHYIVWRGRCFPTNTWIIL